MKPANWNMAKDVTKDILLHLRTRGFLNLYLNKKESFPRKQQDIHSKKMLYVGNESDHCSRKELCCICWFLWYYFFHVFPSVQTLLFKTKPSLTLDFSWCSSIWMSVSLVLSSSLAACRATISASGFSPLLRPFFDMVSYQRESTCLVISNTDCHLFLFLSVPVSSAPTAWHSLRSWTQLLWKPCEK